MGSSRPSAFRRPAPLTDLERTQLEVVRYYDLYQAQRKAQHWWMSWGVAIAFCVGMLTGVAIVVSHTYHCLR